MTEDIPPGVDTPRKETIGFLPPVAVELIALGPGAARVDLAVACMFERERRGSLAGGMLHLDRGLNGALTTLRAEGTFRADRGETLFLSVLPAAIASRALLVVGLGDPEGFSANVLRDAMSTAAKFALRLCAESVSFSPNLLDAGFLAEELPATEPSLLGGLHTAIREELRLNALGYRPAIQLREWLFQAGAAHFDQQLVRFKDAMGGKSETLEEHL